MDAGMLFTVDEVAKRLRVSARWLADQCRASRVEHVHLARQRRFTADQIDMLIASRTVRPTAQVDLDATKQQVLQCLARASRSRSSASGRRAG